MKRSIVALGALLAVSLEPSLAPSIAVAQDAPRPVVTQPPSPTPMRVLFFGNSLLYISGGLQTHTHNLGSADKPALELDPGFRSVHITGASLDQYPLDWLMDTGRLGVKEPFQVVVFAGKSNDAVNDKAKDAYQKQVREFDAIAKKHGAKTALYWLPSFVKPNALADRDLLRMNEQMIVPLANELGAMVIPVGLAYAEAYRQRPNIQLQLGDGNHPTLAGQYLSACVTYASLYGRSPVGNTYAGNYIGIGTLDDDTKQFLQKVAEQTVQKFFGRSSQASAKQ